MMYGMEKVRLIHWMNSHDGYEQVLCTCLFVLSLVSSYIGMWHRRQEFYGSRRFFRPAAYIVPSVLRNLNTTHEKPNAMALCPPIFVPKDHRALGHPHSAGQHHRSSPIGIPRSSFRMSKQWILPKNMFEIDRDVDRFSQACFVCCNTTMDRPTCVSRRTIAGGTKTKANREKTEG